MEVAEIKVSYSNTNLERIKVTNSQILYNLVLKQWNLDINELQEEVNSTSQQGTNSLRYI